MSTHAQVLILPGLFNSGPKHWQSLWHEKHPEYHRIKQENWEAPRCDDWVRTLADAIRKIGSPVILAGHSSACALVGYYAAQYGDGDGRVAAAFLVGPSDTEGPSYPAGPTGFAPMPLQKLPFKSVVVTSTDDPYVTLERAKFFASSWGSRLITLENAGHINAASGYGPWPEGLKWLEELQKTA
jgi:predicted alpha/beta hydrolase family esterase